MLKATPLAFSYTIIPTVLTNNNKKINFSYNKHYPEDLG